LASLSMRKRRNVKRVTGELRPLVASQHINETWSTDFVMGALFKGRRIKSLTLVDDFNRDSRGELIGVIGLEPKRQAFEINDLEESLPCGVPWNSLLSQSFSQRSIWEIAPAGTEKVDAPALCPVPDASYRSSTKLRRDD
jgi:putative transposase